MGTSDDAALAKAGDIQLYSFYEPGLEATTYTITVSQTVNVPSGDDAGQYILDPPAAQTFEVLGPQFTLPPKDIHSTYPPQGHADQPSVLPHVVFNDPHLPWERRMPPENFPDVGNDDLMPWMAVIPFDSNNPAGSPELRLTSDQLKGAKAVYIPQSGGQVTQTPTFSLSMTVSEYLSLDSPRSSPGGPVVHIPPFAKFEKERLQDLLTDTTLIQVIFLTGKLFNDIFQTTNLPGKVSISQYRFAAASHVRNINTTGMASAGVEDTGLFSVIHSLRSGPTDIAQNTAPRSQAAHVVNIQYIDRMDLPADDDFVALVSLYSWTYLCQPPLLVNFVDGMRNIGDQIKHEESMKPMLRCSKAVIQGLEGPNSSSASTLMIDRLTAGYSLVSQRSASGEATVAFTRSPFVPVLPQRPDGWPSWSTNGQDYQILDRKIGIMDVSYSSAWQLGRALAIVDNQFVSAIMRLRVGALKANKNVSALALTNTATKAATFKRLQSTVSKIHAVSKSSLPLPTAGVTDRWALAARTSVVRDAQVAPSATSLTDMDDWVRSPDWYIVNNWVTDKLLFNSIPIHYLITDPAHLPPESIRFFHIDPVWMDCLLDGALSVANHVPGEDDSSRQQIKSQINGYLKGNATDLLSYPQVPSYGLLLRSTVVTAFPDMHVDVSWPDNVDHKGRKDIVVQRLLGPDTLLVLLDRLPDGGEIKSIKLSQPPHQQRFSVGDSLTPSAVEFVFRRVYRDPGHSDNLHEFGDPHTFKRGDSSKGIIYDWDTRCLDLSVLEAELLSSSDGLVKIFPTVWGPQGTYSLTSALLSLQLSDTLKYLEIVSPGASTPASPIPPRQIYMGAAGGSSDTATTKTIKRPEISRASFKQSKNVNSIPRVVQDVPLGLSSSPLQTVPRSLSNLPASLNTLQRPFPPPNVKIVKSSSSNPPIPSGIHHPQFEYTVYPSTTPYDRSLLSKPFVQTSTPYDPDLIFSVNLFPDGRIIKGLKVHEVEFRIPIGEPSLRKARTDIIGGIGLVPVNGKVGSARMLSNQRWVVHQDYQAAYLVLRIIPRSMEMQYPIEWNKSLSFRVNEVQLAGPDGSKLDEGTVIIIVTERYGEWADAGHQLWVDMGYATQQINLQRKK